MRLDLLLRVWRKRGGCSITDIALEGDFLYTMDSARVLRAIQLLDSEIVARGSLQLAQGPGRIFVGAGIIYAAAPLGRGEFSTIDASDSAQLTLISNPDVQAPFVAPGQAIVPNGSGLGLLIGTVNGIPRLNIMDLSDLSNTDRLIVQLDLSASPEALAIASGIAFVAEGRGGPQGDDDHDEVSNEDQIRLGLNPFPVDTDGDGWFDREEINSGTDGNDPNSRPNVTVIAQPPVQIFKPSPETAGVVGAPITVGSPPVTISVPSPDAAGITGSPITVGRPPVAISRPSEDALGTTGKAVHHGQPPVTIEIPKQ